MKRKVLFVLLVCLLSFSVLLTACNKTKNGGEATATSVVQESTKSTEASIAPAESAEQPLSVELPISKEPVTLKFAAATGEQFKKDFEGVEMISRWAKETNVNIKWDTIPSSGWDARKSTLIASKDLPDVFGGGGGLSNEEVLNWSRQGIIIPVNDLIEKYMPRFKAILTQHPEYKQLITAPDGKIYSFPTIVDIDFGSRNQVLYFNKKLLEETGRKYPETTGKYVNLYDQKYTVDDFYQLLKDIKKLHPNSIPFSGPKDSLLELYSSFGLQDTSDHILVKDGKMLFTADKPEWKEATKFFQKLYQEKLLDSEYFTQDYNAFLSKTQKPDNIGTMLIWTAHQSQSNISSPEYKNWVLVAPPVDANGNYNWNKYPKGVSNGTFAISSTSKYPEVAAKFQDYLYEEDNSLQLSMGPYGRNLTKNSDGTITQLDQPKDMSYNEFQSQNLNSMFAFTSEAAKKVKFADVVEMTMEVGNLYKKYQSQTTEMYPNLMVDPEVNKRLSTLKTDLKSYISKKQAEWITGGNIDKDWDNYVSELKKIGLDEYMSIMQKNYDIAASYK